MMGKVALFGLVVACGLGGAAAQVSTADLCPFSLLVRCCGAGDGDARARWSSARAQRSVSARPCVRAHQKCSADLDIDGIVGVDDLPCLLSQVGRTECSVSKGAQSDVASFILAVGVLASAAKQPRTKLPWIIVATLLARGVAAQQSPCNAGAAADDAGMCDDCGVGKYETGNTCILCPAGLYNANPGSTECSACLPGTFSHGGSSACEDCAAGQTDHDGSATTPCQPCLAHSYGSSSGSFSVTK